MITRLTKDHIVKQLLFISATWEIQREQGGEYAH